MGMIDEYYYCNAIQEARAGVVEAFDLLWSKVDTKAGLIAAGILRSRQLADEAKGNAKARVWKAISGAPTSWPAFRAWIITTVKREAFRLYRKRENDQSTAISADACQVAVEIAMARSEQIRQIAQRNAEERLDKTLQAVERLLLPQLNRIQPLVMHRVAIQIDFDWDNLCQATADVAAKLITNRKEPASPKYVLAQWYAVYRLMKKILVEDLDIGVGARAAEEILVRIGRRNPA